MIRKLILSLVIADNFVSNMAKMPFRSRWKLEGGCRKCGRCCREIALKIDPRLLNNRLTTAVVIRWISWLFNFRLIRIEYDKPYLVFACNNQAGDGTCKEYKWRPNVCRNYPLVDYFEEPALYDFCGYRSKRAH